MREPPKPSPLKFGYYYDAKTGYVGKPLLYEDERHILLFGLNGAGKSTRILVENLVTLHNRSVVVFDVKGELAAQTSRARRLLSDVKILDPFGVTKLPSDGFNPLARLDPASSSFSDEASALAEAMVEVESQTPHWAESARGLLVALIMWEVIEARRERRTPSLFNVRVMLTEADEYESYNDPDGKPRKRLVKGFSFTAGRMVKEGGGTIASLIGRFVREDARNELASIVSTAITQTEYLLSEAIRRDVEVTGGADFSQLRQHPTTVYICLPPNEISRMRRWTRMVITAALRELFQPGQVKTLFVLDEYYAALGNLTVINDVWSLVRGYGIQLMPVVQSATLLKTLYGDAWENFAAQAGAVVTIGPTNDLLTSKWLSERSGTDTVWQESYNSGDQTNPQGWSISEGVSTQPVARAFLLPQELMGMKPGTGRIWLPGEGGTSIPFFAPNWWHRPAIRHLIDANPYNPARPAGGRGGRANPDKVPGLLWVIGGTAAALIALFLW